MRSILYILVLSIAAIAGAQVIRSCPKLLLSAPADGDLKSFVESLPKGYTHGFVTVPENWSHPDKGPFLKIFYYGILRPNAVPIVFFNGGPASSSHDSFALMRDSQSALPLDQQVPMLYIDQRGNGFSTNYPEDVTLDSANRITHYGSADIVRDAEAIREALGIKKWRIFGHSYGGTVVFRYLVMHPESLEAAFVYGNALVDPVIDYANRFEMQPRALELYFKKYPKDREVWNSLRSAIPSTFCLSHKEMRVCGPVILDGAAEWVADPSGWPKLHGFLHDSWDGHAIIPAGLQFLAEDQIFPVYSDTEFVSEILDYTDCNAITDMSATGKALDLLKSRGLDLQEMSINEGRLYAAIESPKYDAILRAIPQSRVEIVTPNDLKAALLKHPRIPLIMYGGEADALVAPSSMRLMMEDMQGGGRNGLRFAMFASRGHDGWVTEKQIKNELVLPADELLKRLYR